MTAAGIPWRRPMDGRDPEELHRVSTPLELFFDLTFVVAVASAAASLHHDLTHGELAGLLSYTVVFFAIWWAWVNYSWFASAYDTGDVLFRLSTFVVMTGVLVLAAGTPRAAGPQHDFRISVVGYVIMRLALVPLWLRVAREQPDGRRTALRYVAAITLLQVLWVFRLLMGSGVAGMTVLVLLGLVELSVPYYAEHAGPGTHRHRHHIAERYELFTIIVLGEVLLATSQGITATLEQHGLSMELVSLIVGGLLVVFSLWWLYFKVPLVGSLRRSTAFAFGYIHYVVFASVAAVGASLGTLVDLVQHESTADRRPIELVLAGAIAAYLLSLAGIHALSGWRVSRVGPAVLLSMLLLALGVLDLEPGVAVLAMGVVLAVAVGQHVATSQPDPVSA